MAIYLKYEGIDGEATEHGHKKWIEISSFQFGIGRSIHTRTGASQSREHSEPTVSEVTISKHLDHASPKLFVESCTGSKGKKVEIDIVTTGQESEIPVHYTLEHTLISNYHVSTGGDKPMESLSLNFTKLEMKYTPYTEDHKAGSPVAVHYDIKTTKSG
jgi:type VI secretion system secreted protein Hcp